MRDPAKVYFGKVCARHPELNGRRFVRGGDCTSCKRNRERKYRAENLELERQRGRKYAAQTRRAGSGAPVGASLSYSGAAAECFVLAELHLRCLEAAKFVNGSSRHDLSTIIADKCYTVQVKVGTVNTRTNTIVPRGGITSNLTAAVDLIGRRIRWISNTDEPVPEVLTRETASA